MFKNPGTKDLVLKALKGRDKALGFKDTSEFEQKINALKERLADFKKMHNI